MSTDMMDGAYDVTTRREHGYLEFFLFFFLVFLNFLS
jgi:hypothetical protein